MKIRTAHSNDLPQLVQLWTELMEFHKDHSPVFQLNDESPVTIRKFIENKLDQTNHRIFIGEMKDQVVGMLIASYSEGASLFQLYKKGYIAETIVSSVHRGKGIGKQLQEVAEDWLRSEGATHLELQVSAKNESGKQFWKQAGFEPSTYHFIKKLD